MTGTSRVGRARRRGEREDEDDARHRVEPNATRGPRGIARANVSHRARTIHARRMDEREEGLSRARGRETRGAVARRRMTRHRRIARMNAEPFRDADRARDRDRDRDRDRVERTSASRRARCVS
jgi:hypothetical protein